MNKNKNFYITTPIYYPNAKAHIGTLYSTIIADVFSRIAKLNGLNSIFLTGLDEHGQKVFESAQNNNKDPQKHVDEMTENFKNTFKLWDIDYTIFMRTTNEFHKKAVQKWIQNLIEKDLIYKANYEGWYSKSEESFILEKEIKKWDENKKPLCPFSEKPLEFISQEAYYFRLSEFQEKLLEFYSKNPKWIIPHERQEEVISFVKNGLKDLCISRLKKDLSWGIEFPGDKNHIVYVWADALNNYITSIGYLQDEKKNEFEEIWPANFHVMGKDILRFHAIYWPAFLMASDLELPKHLIIHGWILYNKQKMSKSQGNTIDPEYLLERYGKDKCRYFFVRHFPITQDGHFCYEDFEEKTNAELSDSLGNLVQRILSLIKKKNIEIIKSPEKFEDEEKSLYKKSIETIDEFINQFNLGMIHKSYSSLWHFIDNVNSYIHKKEPWKKNAKDFEIIASAILHSIKQIAVLSWPIIPETSIKILNYIGIKKLDFTYSNIENIKKSWEENFKIYENFSPIFEKVLEEKNTELQNKKENEMETLNKEEIKNNKINFDYFKKVVLMVGEIKEVHEIEKSDKLYRLLVDFGEEKLRTICSGIKNFYKKEDLLGIKAVFVENLEPRKMLGFDSEGMILTTKNDSGIPIIVQVSKEIEAGTVLS
jgi:methionyl-tRNA synthetase